MRKDDDPTVRSGTADDCEWTPALAECLARIFGIDRLSESHWRVISECREERASRGRTPELSTLAARSHMSVCQLESLFPKGQLALAWILAGIIPPSIPPAPSTETTRHEAHAPAANDPAPSTAPKEGANSEPPARSGRFPFPFPETSSNKTRQ